MAGKKNHKRPASKDLSKKAKKVKSAATTDGADQPHTSKARNLRARVTTEEEDAEEEQQSGAEVIDLRSDRGEGSDDDPEVDKSESPAEASDVELG
jgi:hypothetical protein